jgi:hypothetical protein
MSGVLVAIIVVLVVRLAVSGCAYIVVYCDGATAACGATSTIDAMTPVQVTVPISAIPSI